MSRDKDALRTHYDEKIARTEAEVLAAIERQQQLHESVPKEQYVNKQAVCAELTDIPGHPLNTYTRENAVLADVIERIRTRLAEGTDPSDDIHFMRQLSIHYASKGDLLYPLLDSKYGITGPSGMLWTEDDEIRDELARLDRAELRDDDWRAGLEDVLSRAENMIYKEENILFPICAVNFTSDEWKGIYRDSMDYDVCFGIDRRIWADADAGEDRAACDNDADGHTASEIVLPGGHMTQEQLRALLNTIPGEITFVDADNINRFFNEGPKLFKRPSMAIDREVWTCHPPKVEPMVRAIIDDFRAGRRDEVPVWMEKGDRTVLVRYMAVRDTEGAYVGTLEFVQDMEFAREHFSKEI